MIYIEPALIQQVLGGKPLPFIEGGISSDPRLYAATQVLLQSLDACIEPLEEDDAIYDLAQALDVNSGQRGRRKSFDFVAAERARALIHESLDRVITLEELAQASGRDRWSLSRDFRALYGTSPYRYMTQRRLDLARALMFGGHSMAEAAVSAGFFFDQSHMTRQFTQTYGVSPGRWMKKAGPCLRALDLHNHAIRSADPLLKSALDNLASEGDSNAFPTRRDNLHRD